MGVLLPMHGVNQDIDACRFTYYIKELYLAIVIVGVGINDTDEQLGRLYLLEIGHALHDVDGHHAVQRTSEPEGILTDAVLDTDRVKLDTLIGINLGIGIDHLDEEADNGRLLGLIKCYHFHEGV